MNKAEPHKSHSKDNILHKRKRLGQYFSGSKIATLLSRLAIQENMFTAIDPMAGCGDMLNGCAINGFDKSNLYGIEIDPSAYISLKGTLFESGKNFLNCNSFDLTEAHSLTTKHWDLVITNPPYVRYQSQKYSVANDALVPNADEVRKGLIHTIESNLLLNEQEKYIFLTLAKSYSGLSDLAIPSWLLCATMVKNEGTLAMVLPEAWLTREYAVPVNYLLMRLFNLKYIVEDTSGKWFDDAQVKTLLLVATKRKKPLKSAFEEDSSTYLHIKLKDGSSTKNSLVGAIYPESNNPDAKFKEYLSSLDKKFTQEDKSLYSIARIKIDNYKNKIKSRFFKQKWATQLESTNISVGTWFGNSIYQLLEKHRVTAKFSTLDSYGVGIGQGLRTGANKFFYVDRTDTPDIYKLDDVFFNSHLFAPSKYLIPVIRKQSELPRGFEVNINALKGRVLALQEYYTDEETEISGRQTTAINLAEHLDLAKKVNLGTRESPKYFHELSAVVPNIRKAIKGRCEKHWYMLPKFTHRHRPDLLVPRVNNNAPKTFLNSDRDAIVDANFTTLWITEESRLNKYIVLAFLNSDWAIAYLEEAASKMGGGALKVEASHIKQVPVPVMDDECLLKLSKLGEELVHTVEDKSTFVLQKINRVINNSIFEKKSIHALHTIVRQQLETRKKLR